MTASRSGRLGRLLKRLQSWQALVAIAALLVVVGIKVATAAASFATVTDLSVVRAEGASAREKLRLEVVEELRLIRAQLIEIALTTGARQIPRSTP